MAGISTPPTPAASAVLEPEMPANSMLTSTLTWPSPPGSQPTRARDRLISLSVMPAAFIRFAASMKKGIESSRNELYDFSISLSSRNGVSRSSMKNTGTQASPSANATGTRTITSSANTPNRIRATSDGPICATFRFLHQLDVVVELLQGKQDPGETCDRPSEVDSDHVDACQFRTLVVAELRKPPAEAEEDQSDQKYRRMHDQAAQRQAGGGFWMRQHIHVEVRAVANGDTGADHDDPDQAEPRHLLGPDVVGDDIGEPGQNLQGHRQDQYGNQERQHPLQAEVEPVYKFSHELSVNWLNGGRH